MKRLLLPTLGLLLFLQSCDSTSEIDQPQKTIQQDTVVVDTAKVIAVDTSQNMVRDTAGYVNEEEEALKNALKNAKVPQWDFCKCVVTADSINKAMQGEISDADLDFLMERDETVTEKCKVIMAHKSDTPKDRARHERKVKKCLKNAN